MEIISGPAVVTHPDRRGVGIRTVTPFRGMFAVRDQLMASLVDRFDGTVYFRLHEIDMNGPMDIEVGVLTDAGADGSAGERETLLPGGRYASMVYVNHGRRANGTLLDWAAAEGLRLDRDGDVFGCRYEAYLTDPRTERMKTRWQTELAIRLA
jgi:effector-binding domain-containing protein